MRLVRLQGGGDPCAPGPCRLRPANGRGE